MEATERQVLSYKTPEGEFPFRQWRNALTDEDANIAIDVRLTRLQSGNFSDSKPVGKGVSESRVDYGPGFRIYYGVDGTDVVLLYGGDKSTQESDVKRAQGYWKDYKKRKKLWSVQQKTTKKS